MAIETMTPEEYRKLLAEAMSETELRDKYVIPLAKKLGWRCYFTWRSDHSPKGWPDLVLLRQTTDEHGRMVIAELKSEKGTVSPDQEETHRLLRLAQHKVYVWRPSDWLKGRIEEILN